MLIMKRYRNVAYIHNAELFSYKKEQNYVMCRKIDGTWNHHVKWNKSDAEDKYNYFLSNVEAEEKDDKIKFLKKIFLKRDHHKYRRDTTVRKESREE